MCVFECISPYLPYVFMLVASVYCIYTGCIRSTLEEPNTEEQIDTKAALRFPLVGSLVLLSLYIVYKFVPPEYVNMVLSLYFCAMGVFAVSMQYRPYFGHNFGTGLFAVAVSVIQFVYVDWITNNILGIAFSVTAIQMIPLNSTKVGLLLLGLLFFYDIFWVFGTDVMVTVAKSVKGPIKILFPRDIFAEKWEFSLLGLGDLVLPGIYIALMLRFDRHTKTAPKDIYFRTTLLCYACGLLNTFFVMLYFRAAQPALLYLVPWCFFGTFIQAVYRGELSAVYNYDRSVVVPEGGEPKQEEVPTTWKQQVLAAFTEVFGGGSTDAVTPSVTEKKNL